MTRGGIMSANIITLTRVLLAMVTLVLFQMGFSFRVAALPLMIIVFYMDSLDGYIARKLGTASDFGALFDITGDRIVEHVYWIFFTAVGLVSFWVPIIFISRSFLVDTVRSMAFSREGKTPFGEKSMMRSKFTLFLTSGRFMRGMYGFMKLFTFVVLGAFLVLEEDTGQISRHLPEGYMTGLTLFSQFCVWITTALCIIRGIPVLWDGRRYLFDKYFPRELKDAG